MRLNLPLRVRLIFYVTLLLIGQVVFILFVIQSQEVRAIIAEQTEKGILQARNIEQENHVLFVRWDYEGIKENFNAQIKENLLYVVFYDRFNAPFAGDDLIENNDEVFQTSNLSSDAKEGDVYSRIKDLLIPGEGARHRVLEIEVPIFIQDASIKWGSLKIGLSLEEIRAEIRNTRMLLILSGLGGLLVGIVGITLLSRRITDPIKKLADATVKISRGDFNLKIEIESQDEIGNLARSFNEMSHQLLLFKESMEAANRKLVQVEKLASIGHISAGIAHEIRNPLTSVKLNIQKLQGKKSLDEIERAHLEITQEGIAQIEKFIKELLNFARVSELNLDTFILDQIIDGAVKMISDFLGLKKIILKTFYEENLPLVRVDADKIRQVILNILRNACEAVDIGGRIEIHVSTEVDQYGRMAKIAISDNGPGISGRVKKDIFEPFYTTKAQGIGLGLAIAMKIVEQHSGIIRVKSNPESGTIFEILIPSEEEK